MSRSGFFDDELGLDDDPSYSDQYDDEWPIDEATLKAALQRGRTMSQIAQKYDVSVGEVADLIDMYDLDH
ncbi:MULTISPECIES: hypothetical protein [Kordiimonas]|jgi:DNA repair ATPase RecN|uniref:Helix-turn-helix domain of resolvase n=1 Tax=Kordiimonas lacus TaxID=637679 RepID=A0A1G6T1H7_9PROT|nr:MULTISPECIES: hypothetical protein [Kordiimonas]SDD22235.1 hypothetical protein SAMN04488071_0053 [Kordiimonas lacus]